MAASHTCNLAVCLLLLLRTAAIDASAHDLTPLEKDAGIFEDSQGNIHIRGSRLQPNTTVYINGVDVLERVRHAQQLTETFHANQALIDHLALASPYTLPKRIYAIAGVSSAAVERSNGVDSWQAASTSGITRSNMGCAVYFQNIYCVGGQNDFGVNLGLVEAFDGFRWTKAASMPTARAGLGVIAYDGLLYAIGGLDATGEATATVETFDGVSWRSAPSLPAARDHHATVVFRGRIRVLGGVSGDQIVSSMLSFDGQQWSDQFSLPEPRRDFGAVVYQGRIIVAGGRTLNDNHLNTVVAFDGEAWAPLPPLKSTLTFFGMCVLDNAVYVIGGYEDPREVFAKTWRLTESASGWVEGPRLSAPRWQLAAVVFPQ